MKISLGFSVCFILACSNAFHQHYDQSGTDDIRHHDTSQLLIQEGDPEIDGFNLRPMGLHKKYQVEVTTTLPQIVLRSYCLKPRGTFPHPRDCSKYLDCWDGRVLEKSCPDELVFSDIPGVHCDFLVYVDCGNRSSGVSELVTTTKPPSTTPPPSSTPPTDLGLTQIGEGFYLFVMDKKISWQMARNHCMQLGLNLLTITDKKEDDLIIKKINEIEKPFPFTPGPLGSGLYWIGATDEVKEGQFKWAGTGSDVTYTNWLPSQPDNWKGDENCVHYWRLNGKIMWNDAHCGLEMRFICEWNKQ